MPAVTHSVLRFDRFTLDRTRGALSDGKIDINLPPKPFEVLSYLATNAGRLVSKTELFEAVWPGVTVSDDSLVQCIRELRRKLGDDQHRLIKTMSRRGYLFDVSVLEGDVRVLAPSAATDAPLSTLMLPDRPSLAVLPFLNMSRNTDDDYFADGMVEEIITALSQFSRLFVIARNSSFTYKGRDVDAKQIGRELGVRYLLEGSVQRAGNRLRLTAQLIDASDGMHLWAQRFDGVLTDVFALHDELVANVVGGIIPRLTESECERAERKPTRSLDAYDYYMRGLSRYDETKEGVTEAQRLYRLAIDFDSRYAVAHASLALCAEARMRNGWMSDPPREVREAERLARLAAELGRDDASALAPAGFVLARLGDLDAAAAFIDRALTLNVNLARAWQFSGWVRIWLGEVELAILHATRAMRFSPVDPWLCSMQTAVAFAHFFAGRHDEACTWATMALRERHFQPALRIAAASNALAGRIEKAREAVAHLRRINPSLRLSNLKASSAIQRRPEFFTLYREAMRKAGLPD
jgi:TolB-like protein